MKTKLNQFSKTMMSAAANAELAPKAHMLGTVMVCVKIIMIEAAIIMPLLASAAIIKNLIL